jgi:hypothetical protein
MLGTNHDGQSTIQIPADTPLADELSRDDVVEMAKLTTAQTALPRLREIGALLYSSALTMSSHIFLASPKSIIVLSR